MNRNTKLLYKKKSEDLKALKESIEYVKNLNFFQKKKFKKSSNSKVA